MILKKLELEGLLYAHGTATSGRIEECRYIRLISKEGYEDLWLPGVGAIQKKEKLLPGGRRTNVRRGWTRGKSDIYDILTHLTFLFIESEKNS